MISVDLAAKSFGDTQILGAIKLCLGSGESAAIVGPSGVGKSTLLRIIAGLDQRFDGHVQRTGRLAMVFQETTLLPWRSVQKNLALIHPDLAFAELDTMLDRVGLSEHADKFPRQLSLGQQRRLSLARAFVGQPGILILDEPFTSLDADLHEDMLFLTEELLEDVRPTTVLVTHSMDEAERLASRIWHLNGQPARLSERA